MPDDDEAPPSAEEQRVAVPAAAVAAAAPHVVMPSGLATHTVLAAAAQAAVAAAPPHLVVPAAAAGPQAPMGPVAPLQLVPAPLPLPLYADVPAAPLSPPPPPPPPPIVQQQAQPLQLVQQHARQPVAAATAMPGALQHQQAALHYAALVPAPPADPAAAPLPSKRKRMARLRDEAWPLVQLGKEVRSALTGLNLSERTRQRLMPLLT